MFQLFPAQCVCVFTCKLVQWLRKESCCVSDYIFKLFVHISCMCVSVHSTQHTGHLSSYAIVQMVL